MALSDLLVTDDKLSDELVENLLKGRVSLVKTGKKIILTRQSNNFTNKTKILLFLAGGKAWELLDEFDPSFSPSELEKEINIKGNSLRPILKELSDDLCVSNENGKYQITNRGICELETMLKDSTEDDKGISVRKRKTTQHINKKNQPNTQSKAASIEELIQEGFFSSPKDNQEILMELSRRGVSLKPTSLSAYLLPLIRRKALIRDQVMKNNRKMWTYKVK